MNYHYLSFTREQNGNKQIFGRASVDKTKLVLKANQSSANDGYGYFGGRGQQYRQGYIGDEYVYNYFPNNFIDATITITNAEISTVLASFGPFSNGNIYQSTQSNPIELVIKSTNYAADVLNCYVELPNCMITQAEFKYSRDADRIFCDLILQSRYNADALKIANINKYDLPLFFTMDENLFTHCMECGTQIYKPKDKCWACENGI